MTVHRSKLKMTYQQIYSIGNSQYVSIRRPFREALDLHTGDYVSVTLVGDSLVIRKVREK